MVGRHIAVVVTVCAMMLGLSFDRAFAQTASFDGANPLAGWTTTGTVTADATRNHTTGGSKSMMVAPGARATWMLRSSDDSGSVDLWVYEDGTTRTDPTIRGAGPHLGVVTTTGRVLTVGPIYAPYLSGNTTYAASEYTPATESPWFKVTYLALSRTVGWHRWTFNFDPVAGLKIFHNGSEVTRYKWSTSTVGGFAGVTVIGDLNSDNPQTTWVDDVAVTLGPPMLVTPGHVDLLIGVLPDADPVVTGPTPEIVPELAGQHPRLLFSQADLADLAAFRSTPDGQRLWNLVVSYRTSTLGVGDTTFQTDATEAQRKGFWRLPTVALYYVFTRDAAYLTKAVDYMEFLLDLPNWETTSEIDSGMGAANMMVGAALAYDWLYNDLDPTFREQFRQKLWLHARRMYYCGHLMYLNNTHYWQGDPLNNHRWHRDAGFALCTLAAYTGASDQKWLMQQLYNELNYAATWLPDDGTSHEGPGYMVFGGSHLTVALDAADRCLGTEFLRRPFFENCCDYLIQTHTPGFDHMFNYGDQGGVTAGVWGYDVFQLKAASVWQQSNTIATLDALMNQLGVDVIAAWAGFLWYPQDLAKGTVEGMDNARFFPDLGLLYLRQGWDANLPGAMFKCGPFGGYTLNHYRVDNGFCYINVAHDDPDANSFILYRDGTFLAETDRYSSSKKSANLNTVLINGLGQVAVGRPEGGTWSQPATGSNDMTEMAVVTSYAKNGANVAIEGEAAGSYPAWSQDGKTRPALNRYRRVFVWVPGKYVLALDDIRAPQSVEITWLMQGHDLYADNAASGIYRLADGTVNCQFQVVSDRTSTQTIGTSPADNKGTILGWKQLQLKSTASTMRLASVYDLWNRGGVTVSLATIDADHATVTVTGPGFSDTWTWQAGAAQFGPSQVVGWQNDGTQIISMTQPEPRTRALIATITGDIQPLQTSASLDAEWTYQNAPNSTGNNHKCLLTISVDGDPNGNASYTTNVTVDPTSAGGVSVEATADPLVWVIRGGLYGTDPIGPVRLNVTVDGYEVGGQGAATVDMLVSRLGDVNGDTFTTTADNVEMAKRLNGLTTGTRPYDLDADGFVTTSDAVLLSKILNGLTIN